MCHFLHQLLLVAGPPAKRHVKDSGVNAGFKAWLACVCAWWREGVVGESGGLVSDGGRRSLCLPALTRRGMNRQMYMCVCLEVRAALCGAYVSPVCTVGRGSSVCYEVTTHTQC